MFIYTKYAGNRRRVALVAGGFALLLIVGYLVTQVPREPTDVAVPPAVNGGADVDPPPSNLQPAETSTLGGILSVSDQPAGSSVAIESYAYGKEAWVAVREPAPSGSGLPLGSILGAAKFHPHHTSGTIPLLRDTVPGQTYYVVVYLPDGDGVFDYQLDTLLVAEGGTPLAAPFAATE